LKGVNYVNMEHPKWLESKKDVVDFVKKVLKKAGKL